MKKGVEGGIKNLNQRCLSARIFTIICRKTVNKGGWNFLRGGGNDSAQNSNQ